MRFPEVHLSTPAGVRGLRVKGVIFEIRTYVCDPVTSSSRERSAVREFTSARFSFLVGAQSRDVP